MTTAILSIARLQHDVSFGTNEDWIDSVPLLDSGGNPVNLAGISFAMQVRHAPADATVFIAASTTDGTLSITAPNTLVFTIPLSSMTNVPIGNHVYDVVASADGHERIAIMGAANLFEGVTRPPLET
jgi:hypothetical protein